MLLKWKKAGMQYNNFNFRFAITYCCCWYILYSNKKLNLIAQFSVFCGAILNDCPTIVKILRWMNSLVEKSCWLGSKRKRVWCACSLGARGWVAAGRCSGSRRPKTHQHHHSHINPRTPPLHSLTSSFSYHCLLSLAWRLRSPTPCTPRCSR